MPGKIEVDTFQIRSGIPYKEYEEWALIFQKGGDNDGSVSIFDPEDKKERAIWLDKNQIKVMISLLESFIGE